MGSPDMMESFLPTDFSGVSAVSAPRRSTGDHRGRHYLTSRSPSGASPHITGSHTAITSRLTALPDDAITAVMLALIVLPLSSLSIDSCYCTTLSFFTGIVPSSPFVGPPLGPCLSCSQFRLSFVSLYVRILTSQFDAFRRS